MTKGQNSSPTRKGDQQKQPMSFPLESFLKKLKEDLREQTRKSDKE